MSGVFLFFDPDGVSSALIQTFKDRLEERVSRVPGQVVDTLSGPLLVGAASHHGVLPSGGIAENESGLLLSTGSCWIKHDTEALATPAEILKVFANTRAMDKPRFHGSVSLADCDHNRAELTI